MYIHYIFISIINDIMYDIKKIKKVVKNNISKKRYSHTLSVEKLAVKLAKIHHVDVEKARVAALLHDVCKEIPPEKIAKLTEKDERFNTYPNINTLHGVAAAKFAEKEFGITDKEILEAISNHVIPAKKVGKLAKIIYVADKLDPTRKKFMNLSNPIFLRELAANNLNTCFNAIVKRNKR